MDNKFTTDEILRSAWRSLGGNPNMDSFPRGFWPDVARVAVEMAQQGTLEPLLDFRPTRAGSVTVSVARKQPKQLSEQLAETVADDNDNPFSF